MDNYTLAVLETVQMVAEVNLPTPVAKGTARRKPAIPGWTSEVKPFKDSAFFWHQIWQSCGCPVNTEVHKIMKKTRNLYHFQFRKCKNAEIAKSTKRA